MSLATEHNAHLFLVSVGLAKGLAKGLEDGATCAAAKALACCSWCYQRDPTSRCRQSLAPRSYRISKSKTRGLGHLQNSKDSLIPKVDMLVPWCTCWTSVHGIGGRKALGKANLPDNLQTLQTCACFLWPMSLGANSHTQATGNGRAKQLFLKTSWFLSVLLNGVLHGLAAPQFACFPGAI